MRGWQPDDEDWSDIRGGFLSGAAAGLVVVVWMWLAHPGEETISSRGFDMGGGFAGSPSSRPSGSSMIFAQRESDPKELAKAGLPTDAKGLTGGGAQK